MDPLWPVAVLVAVILVAVGVRSLLRAAAAASRPDLDAVPLHEVELPHEAGVMLALYAIGWEIEQTSWWRPGACWHDTKEDQDG